MSDLLLARGRWAFDLKVFCLEILQVNFGHVRYVYAVVTQGVAGSFPGWVTAYKIQYLSNSMNKWMVYKERNSVKVNLTCLTSLVMSICLLYINIIS